MTRRSTLRRIVPALVYCPWFFTLGLAGCLRQPAPLPDDSVGDLRVSMAPPALHFETTRRSHEAPLRSQLEGFSCTVDGSPLPIRELLRTTDDTPAKRSWLGTVASQRQRPSLTAEIISPDLTRVTLDCSPLHARATEISLPAHGERWFGVTECPAQTEDQSPAVENTGRTVLYGVDALCPVTRYANARAPFFFTDHGYGIVVHSDQVGRFQFAQEKRTTIHFDGPKVTLDIIRKNSPREILESYLEQNGVPRMPPDWAFGSGWWRSDIHDRMDGLPNAQANVERDMRELRTRGIPATMYIFDRPYGSGKYGWGNFDFGDSFPDPQAMLASIGHEGLQTVVWVANRAINQLREEATARGYLPEDFRGAEWPAIDLDTEEARAWFRSKLEIYARLGIRGFKIDRGDEEEMDPALVNRNPAQFIELAADALKRVHGEDYLLISRNALGSGQRFTGIWGGDSEATFEGLRRSVVSALRAGLLGYSFWGADTAGFKGAATKELWARWMEFSAYSPLLEVHLCRSNSLLWSDFDEELLSIVRNFTRRHHQLIPYVRTAMRSAQTRGEPIMRPLFFDFGDDPVAYTITDEYLYGPSLLVAPVTTDGQRSRRVYLPAGEWFALDNPRQQLSGNNWYEVNAPLASTPVFVRSGSIVPLGDIVRGNNPLKERWRPQLELHIYLGAETHGTTSYFDGNTSYDLRFEQRGNRLFVDAPPLPSQVAVKVHRTEPKKLRVVMRRLSSSAHRTKLK